MLDACRPSFLSFVVYFVCYFIIGGEYVPMAAADALFRRIAPPRTNKRPKADVYISDTTVTAHVT